MFPVWITGNLTRDPELRPTNSGTMMTRFSIATSKRVKNKDTGDYENGPASFWDCIAWAELAEQVAETLEKGNPVIAYGEIEQQKYTANDGTEKTGIQVVVRNIGLDLARAKRRSSESRPRRQDDNIEPPF